MPPADPTPIAKDAKKSSPRSVDEAVRYYRNAARASRTKKAYVKAWNAFEVWANENRHKPLPASALTVERYLSMRADQHRKVATIEMDLVAISQTHLAAGYPSPRSEERVREVLRGIRRDTKTAQAQKAPLLPEDLRKICAVLPDNLRGIRDKALLLLGFASASRRQELASFRVEDLTDSGNKRGLVLTLRASKTDQEGNGFRKAIPFAKDKDLCPVLAVRAWLTLSQIKDGPLFREVDRHGNVSPTPLNPRSISMIIKRAAEAAKLPFQQISGHSLRAGLATAAARAGKSERAIMRMTGHKSPKMVNRYIREQEIWHDCASDGVI